MTMCGVGRMWRHLRSEEGVTLVELTVVTLVFGLITATIMTVMITLTSSAVRQESATQNQETARQALDLLQKDLRGADPISALSTVALYANRIDITLLSSQGPQAFIRWRLSGTDLLRETLSSAGGSTVTSSQVVAKNVTNASAGIPLFRYYGADGAEMTSSNAQPNDLAHCSASIHIAVLARPSTNAPAITAESDAALRNVTPGGLTC